MIGTLLFYFLGALLAVVAGYFFDLGRFLIGFGIATTAILSMSYSNNYYDAEADQYNTPTPFSGGSTGLLKNKHTYTLLKPVSLMFMGLSIILAFLFVMMYSFSFEFLIYVITGNILGWFYTAPPLKFSYRGLGEIATVVTVGLMLPGLGYYILSRSFDPLFLVFIVPVMFYVMIFILNAEIPDFESDRKGNKKNLIIQKNPRFGLQIAGLCGVIVVLYYFGFYITNVMSLIVDFRVMILFSLLPVSFVSISIAPRFVRRYGTLRLVMNNLTSILLVVLLSDIYLLYIIFTK
ncbi:MAG: prenyltransferase [Euryarchaeota archaeon]|nr:prenyltransferase [Euryarchaeota archaeon]